MKKNQLVSAIKKISVLSFAGLLAVTSLTACGKSDGDASSEDKEGVETIKVGLPNSFDQVAYLDENGELVGFEVDLLKRIDEELPQYEFEYEESTFDNILISLDAGKIDLGSHEFEYSDERAEKYLFAQEGYRDFSIYLISLKGSGYTTLESLAGKTIGAISNTDNCALLIDKYSKENPDKAITEDYYGDVEDSVVVQSLKEGRWEATYNTLNSYNDWVKEYGDIFDLGDAINESDAYFLYPKDDKYIPLRDAVDEVIKEIKASGELDELSNKWFGYDAYQK